MRKKVKIKAFILNYTILITMFSLSIFYIFIIFLNLNTLKTFNHEKEREDFLALSNTSRVINYELFLVDKYILEKKLTSLEDFITKNTETSYLWESEKSRLSSSLGGYKIIFISDLNKITTSGTHSLTFFFEKIITLGDIKIKITTDQLIDSFYFDSNTKTFTINKSFQIKTLRVTSYY